MLLESPLLFDEINREKSVVEVESTHIPVISIEHLIEMKRRTGRKQDEADVQVLEKIRKIESREKKNG